MAMEPEFRNNISNKADTTEGIQVKNPFVQVAYDFFKRHSIKFFIILFLFLAVFISLLVYANIKILTFRKFIVSPFDIPTTTYGVVFGGGVNEDKTLGPMPKDRLIQGIALFKPGKIEHLMVTGDDGQMRGDEVGVMSKLAIEYGVPKEKVLIDPHGYRTYESCFRESNTYGVKKAVVVSQSFHLPRIIYLCRHFGIETVGVAADFQSYGWDNFYMNVRETGARLKAWWQITLTKPLPRNLSRK